MRKLRSMLWGVTAAAMVAFAVGCGGGSDNNSVSDFAGAYTGSYAGTTSTGSAVSGRFTINISNNGQVTGSLIGPNNNLPVTGTVDDDGDIRFATAAGANQISVQGEVDTIDSAVLGTGTFSQTVNGVQNASSGRAAFARARTTANPFAGNYAGTFTSTSGTASSGTLNVTADVNGAIEGIVNYNGSATVYRVTGVVSPAGNVQIFAVGDRGGAPRLQFVTTFEGDGDINASNNIATLTGLFSTVEAGNTTSQGNFTLTEQPVQ
jgi:hypothetical protein